MFDTKPRKKFTTAPEKVSRLLSDYPAGVPVNNMWYIYLSIVAVTYTKQNSSGTWQYFDEYIASDLSEHPVTWKQKDKKMRELEFYASHFDEKIVEEDELQNINVTTCGFLSRTRNIGRITGSETCLLSIIPGLSLVSFVWLRTWSMSTISFLFVTWKITDMWNFSHNADGSFNSTE